LYSNLIFFSLQKGRKKAVQKLSGYEWSFEQIPFLATIIRVSQIAGVFQKMIFESCTLYHIMPFAKIIGPVEKKVTKSWF